MFLKNKLNHYHWKELSRHFPHHIILLKQESKSILNAFYYFCNFICTCITNSSHAMQQKLETPKLKYSLWTENKTFNILPFNEDL